MTEVKARSVRTNMIFNTVGSTVYYFCVWLASVIIVRLSGFVDAGLFSLAMTVTNSPAVIGLFNMRNYQASDLNGQYTDKTYLTSRTVSNTISFVICLIMVLFYRYDLMKSLTILMFMGFKIVEGAADVYYGIDQRKERLDYAGISMTLRGIGSLAAFIVVFLLSKSLLVSFLAMTLVSLSVVVLYDVRKTKPLLDGRREDALWKNVGLLLLTCLPLAVVLFLNNLSIMIPRLALESSYGEEIMGYYSSVSSPTVVVQVAAQTLFAPLVPGLTRHFNAKEKKPFLKKIFGFFAFAGVLTLLAIALAWFFGEWLLTTFFGEAIGPYVYLFIPILLMSILIAVNVALFAIVTLMRIIKPQYLVGAAGIAASVILSLTAVPTMSMDGVVMATMISMGVQIGIQIILIAVGIRRQFHE